MTVQSHIWQIIPRDGMPRNSRYPNGTTTLDPNQTLDGTVLKTITDGMNPGEFFYLEGGANDPALPDGYTSYQGVQMSGTKNDSSDFWGTVAVWVPSLTRVYQILDRTPGTDAEHSVALSGYDAQSHAWVRNTVPDRSNQSFGAPHIYNHWAVDPDRLKKYRPDGTTLWVYDMQTDQWSQEAWSGWAVGRTNAIAYHDNLGEMLGLDGDGVVIAWDPDADSTRQLGSNANDTGRHAVAVYNRVRNEALFAGGDNVAHLTLVASDGTVTSGSTPTSVYNGDSSPHSRLFLTYDPLSGNYLMFYETTRELWEYDADADQWQLALSLSGTGDDYPGFHGYLMAAIPEAGVIMWNHRSSPRLYKHATVL